MTARIWRYIFHRHEFTEFVGRTCDGATLGWGGDIVPCYSITERCQCGKERTQRGMLLPLVSFRKDADHWPLDDDGKRMGIAKL